MDKTIIVTPVNKVEVDSAKSTLPIQLVGDRVLIERMPADEYLDADKKFKKPVDYIEPYQTGKMMCIGGGEYGTPIPQSLAIGMIVNYWHAQSLELVVDKKKYDCVRASDVWAIL